MSGLYYIQVAPDGRVIQQRTVEQPDAGPPLPPPQEPGSVFELIPDKVSWASAPTPTCGLYWVDGAPKWIETASLAELKAAAIAKTFADVDAVVRDAVGNRTHEYELAEQAARTFAAAGYAGECSRFVVSYARNNFTLQEQSNEWAAQNIIARANAFDWATDEMRDKRMYYGVRMQSAATHAELAAAVAGWDDFIAGLRAQLGL